MYTILPFNFTRCGGEELLVNEGGVFTFVDAALFEQFIHQRLDVHSEAFRDLESGLFAAAGDAAGAVRRTAARYRSRMAFLRDFTALHMMVITLRCNQRCAYCQVSCADEDAARYDMPVATAEKIVDFIFSSPTRCPKIEFQGGEPTLNWPAVTATVEKAEQLAARQGKDVEFVICTNLLAVTDAQLRYCRDHRIQISTSLDGPEALHDRCRIARAGGATHARVLERLDRARNILGGDGVSALMTTTAFSLNHLRDVVDEYARLGMDGIFIRSLNPYGFAAEEASTLGYRMEDFVEKYIDVLDYIIALNRRVYFPEYFATLLLTRILTARSTGFVDLQSPSGAGISGAIYDFDGSVFPADEARMLARMGDRHFCLGNVHRDSWEQIFAGPRLRALTRASCTETTVPCAWCAYRAFCGTDPVRNYLESGNERRNMAGSPFCVKHKTIFNRLFSLVRHATEQEKDVIWSWITRNPELVRREDRQG